jgi:hypothetical protein
MLAFGGDGLVVVDRAHFQELLDAPEDRLSFNLSLVKGGSFDYAFHSNIRNSYHIELIRNRLTQNLGTKMSDIMDELNTAFAEEIEPFIGEGIQPFRLG